MSEARLIDAEGFGIVLLTDDPDAAVSWIASRSGGEDITGARRGRVP
jgi:hypothetical protein